MKRTPRHFLSRVVLLCLLAPAIARADLAADVQTVLADKLLARGAVGVEIVKLADKPEADRVVFSHQAAELYVPASNLKLITTAAALERFGPGFKFRTVLLKRGNDLVFVGDGDPTLGDAEMLEKVGWGTTTVFEAWAKQLKSRGVTSVGDVIVDDGVFDAVYVHPNWPGDQLHKRYVAGVGGINLNANCVDFTVQAQRTAGTVVAFRTDPPDTRYVDVRNSCASGDENKIWLSRNVGGNHVVLRGEAACCGPVVVSVTIDDPPMFAATVLAETLGRAGIKVGGSVKRDPDVPRQRLAAEEAKNAGWAAVVGIHETPLATVLARANKDSMNLYAESLCKRLGYAATSQPGSWASGTAAVGEYLVGIGLDESEFKLDDGCGLSKKNAISAHAVARVLAHEFHEKNREAFMASLSIAGRDGTLEDRFRTMGDLRGRVLGKSGYVSGVRSLSGYLKAKDGSDYAFSILMNRVSDAAQIKLLQERIVKAVDDHASALAAGR